MATRSRSNNSEQASKATRQQPEKSAKRSRARQGSASKLPERAEHPFSSSQTILPGKLPNLLKESELADATTQEKIEYLSLLERYILSQEQEQLKDLASFSRAAWKVLETAAEFKWNWHLDLICEYLTLARDRIVRRFIFNVPPQTTKSRLVTVFYPAWTWTSLPGRRFMAISYSGGQDGLSTLHSLERRRVMTAEWFQKTFSGRVDFIRKGETEFENAAGGRMTSTSTDGTITGKGAHDIIMDDLINPKQAESDAERKKAIKCLDEVIPSRLSDQVTGVMIVVEQRTLRVPKILALLIPEILSDLVLAGRNSSLLPLLLGKRGGRREEDARNAETSRNRNLAQGGTPEDGSSSFGWSVCAIGPSHR